MRPKRLIFDISTLARAGGQAVGIVRVVRQYANWARANRPDVVFAVADTRIDGFRAVRAEWLDPLLQGTAVVDMSVLPSAERGHEHNGGLRGWVLHPRRRALVALERMRLTSGRPIARMADWLSSLFLSSRYRSELTDPQGMRRALVPYEMAAAEPINLDAGDVLVLTGSEWGYLHFDRLRDSKQRLGFAVVLLTYDTIPLLFPQFYRPDDAQAYRRFFHNMVPLADLLIVTARQVETDAGDYCRANGLRMPNCRIVPLGADPVRVAAARASLLPAGLEAGRYALYVSTIEPRKNHALLLSVWKRLCAEGVPQAHGFKLALVGRPGWMVEDLLAALRGHAKQGYGLVMLSDVNDRQLADLYRGAAFCLYPSLYEGYGLPIVEGFHHGKAVLASTGGALPAVVGAFSPSLDPRDENAWYGALKRWIVEPQLRAPAEAAIRERFRHPDWDEASRRFFDAVDEGLG